jgi:hypothetical protein
MECNHRQVRRVSRVGNILSILSKGVVLMSQSTQPILDESSGVSGSVFGQPRGWLRLEGLAALGGAIALYGHGGHSWMWFAIFFLLPDISFAGYLAGPRVGAICYNVAHSYVSPAAVAVALHLLGMSLAIPLVWIGHIGFDRLLGYGLKYDDSFGHTHLGRLGRGAK